LKFPRPGGDVQAYVYREGGEYRASVYVVAPGQGPAPLAAESFTGATEAEVEDAVRAWVERNHPKAR